MSRGIAFWRNGRYTVEVQVGDGEEAKAKIGYSRGEIDTWLMTHWANPLRLRMMALTGRDQVGLAKWAYGLGLVWLWVPLVSVGGGMVMGVLGMVWLASTILVWRQTNQVRTQYQVGNAAGVEGVCEFLIGFRLVWLFLGVALLLSRGSAPRAWIMAVGLGLQITGAYWATGWPSLSIPVTTVAVRPPRVRKGKA